MVSKFSSIINIDATNTLQIVDCNNMDRKIRQDINIGNNIRNIRNERGMTQEYVITQLQLMGIDISRSIYSQIECGTYNVRVSELIALANLFSTDINTFFGYNSLEQK